MAYLAGGDVAAYLDRIGYAGSRAATGATLRALHLARPDAAVREPGYPPETADPTRRAAAVRPDHAPQIAPSNGGGSVTGTQDGMDHAR